VITAIPDVVRENSEQTFARQLADKGHVECAADDPDGTTEWHDRVQKTEGNCTIEWRFKRFSKPA
jgi:hypothetical protein